jgi:hypothetical protein
MHVSKRLDLALLGRELDAAGVPHRGLGLTGSATDGEVYTFDGDPGTPTELPPEAAPVVAAHDASKKDRTASFERAEDAERLRIINERARADPAYAALADLALRERP